MCYVPLASLVRHDRGCRSKQTFQVRGSGADPVLRSRLQPDRCAHRASRGRRAIEARPVSFRRRDHRAPEYLALNPEGKAPTLLVDRPLTEVAAILFYLARRSPGPGLLPPDAEGEAHALSWMSFAPRRCTRPDGRASTTPMRSTEWPTSDWLGEAG